MAGCSRAGQALGSPQPERGRHHDIPETRTGQLWIGTHGGGVTVYPTGRRVWCVRPVVGAGAISACQRQCDCRGRKRQPLVGTDGEGLDLVRADGTVVKVFRHDPGNPATLSANTVYASRSTLRINLGRH
jgi:hypothetical protein